jgi:WD40 repeat protein
VTSIQFHPDGLVLAVGLQNGCIRVYDIRTQEMAMELKGIHGCAVK